MVNIPGWALMLLSLVGVPILDKIATQLEAAAVKTPETFDDALAGMFRTVVDVLKTGSIFAAKTK